jgi:type I restriction enzyme S subunit
MVDLQESKTYHRGESAIFLKTNEQFGGLSNMAGGYPLSVNSIRIRTSEALYQACRFPHKPDIQKLILGQASPMTAKMVSKPYRKDSRADWDKVRVQIMRWCLRVKLTQHWETFGDLLLSTGDQPIVEESRRDTFWGAKATSTGTLIGTNVLGQLLTELREQLKSPYLDELRVIEPPALPQFFLIEKPIGVIEGSSPKPGVVPEVYERLRLDGVTTSETSSHVEAKEAAVEEMSDVILTPSSPIQLALPSFFN